MNTDEKLTEKELNGRNVRSGCCIFSSVNHHQCAKFCRMVTGASLGPERVDKLLVKKVRNSATVPKRGRNRAAGYDSSSAKDVVIPEKMKKKRCGADRISDFYPSRYLRWDFSPLNTCCKAVHRCGGRSCGCRLPPRAGRRSV